MPRARSSGFATVTSRDIARAANVSQALVSRAFTGNGRIAPTTREHILEVARQLGWQPNALARSMVTGDAPLVAVITTRLSFDWRAQVLSRVLGAIRDWHLKPLLFYAEEDQEVDRLLAEAIGWRTRGVIVTAGVISEERAAAILSHGQFLASLNRPARHSDAFAVATDNLDGGATAANLLLAEGRERFLVLAGGPTDWASGRRAQGFVAALDAAGRTATVWNNPVMSIEAGRDAAARFLGLPSPSRPDAVFATNDALALGFIDGVRERVDVPQALSVIGFDNLPAASWPPYRLTTFEQPLAEMMRRLIAHVDRHQQAASASIQDHDERAADGVIYCPPRLIRRSTTRVSQ